MDLASETSTVVHPVTTQARWGHVDSKAGSLSKGGEPVLLVVEVDELASLGSMTSWLGLDPGLRLVQVVAGHVVTRVWKLRRGCWHVGTWYNKLLNGYF